MEQHDHPKGALTLMLIYVFLIAAVWFSIYAMLLARG